MALRVRRPMKWAGVRLDKGDLLPGRQPEGRQLRTLSDNGFIEQAPEPQLGIGPHAELASAGKD